MSEQHVIAAAMRAGGAAWASDVRAAVDAEINRLAWDDICVVRPQLDSRELEVRERRAREQELEATCRAFEDRLAADVATSRELEASRQQLASMLASASWRLTAPMRALKQLLSSP